MKFFFVNLEHFFLVETIENKFSASLRLLAVMQFKQYSLHKITLIKQLLFDLILPVKNVFSPKS